ncbi:MAG: response regulator, partial [Chloroflexota bacterium]
NETLRASLVDYLHMWQYQTVEAANGQEALRQLAQRGQDVSLILSDAVMPMMGGIDLLRTIQQQGSQVPMILLTGHPLDEDEVNTVRSLGLHAWLPKPPDISKLASLIAEALIT